ncbi:MAG: transketolase C-terminal domain-containing protein [Bdellovibrionota bacterium]
MPVSSQKISQAEKGAWRILEKTNPTLIIFATGSEVSLALDVAKILEQKGENPDVISVPCWELFQQQNKEYQEEILNWSCKKRVSIEAGVTLGWERFVGAEGLCIGIDHFGASAPAQDLEREFGFTTDAIVKKIEEKFY